MKTELMRELFERTYAKLPLEKATNSSGKIYYLEAAIDERWYGFQAACNMFLPHIEVIADDAEIVSGDVCLHEDGSIRIAGYSKAEWESKAIPSHKYPFIKTLQRNGKYAIRESELKQGEK
jgi:hypothetical protein